LSTDRYSIGAVVNYCTNEYPFLIPCLEQLQHFCARVIVPVCDHFFDGTAEDIRLLRRSQDEAGQLGEFLPWHFDPAEDTGDAGRMYWEGKARWLGVERLEDCEHILFVDVDEVIDGRRFVAWLEGFRASIEGPSGLLELNWRHFDAARFVFYWYFRTTAFRARTRESQGLLYRRRCLTRESVISRYARTSLFKMAPGLKADGVRGLDGAPLVHHYSWVRTRSQMLRKVRSFGHASERNWEKLVEEEFSHAGSDSGPKNLSGGRNSVEPPIPRLAGGRYGRIPGTRRAGRSHCRAKSGHRL
jgi:hypothetical protein